MIQPFEDFRKSLSSIRYAEMRDAARTDNDAFDQMREFLLSRYEGVEVQHSFVERGGEVVDCVPVEQQPSLRSGGDVAVPPDPPPTLPAGAAERPGTGPTTHVPPHLHPDYHDGFGNQMWCPPGTVPMLRHTLERLVTNYSTMDEFLIGPRAADNSRRHARGGHEGDNLGGASYVNIWPHQLIPPQLLSSASQQWYSNASVPFADLQTVECGWRAGVIANTTQQPDALPRLFVFYTNKDYLPGHGCYNDYCRGRSFVYAAGANHVLHGAFAVSTPGGTQYEAQMGFKLTQGAWWFHIQNTWIGYYPVSLFGGGTLSQHATMASFGGETTTGFGVFPTMGSGRFPSEGYGRAAFQRLAAVNDLQGVPRHANLTPGQVSPGCYNISITSDPASTWGTSLFFGGPGGMNCPLA